jgi:hypothetical protein
VGVIVIIAHLLVSLKDRTRARSVARPGLPAGPSAGDQGTGDGGARPAIYGRCVADDEAADDDVEKLDLGQFRDLDDALKQLADSRIYEDVIEAAFARPHRYTVLTMFAQSACTRFRGLHEGIVREVAASNPHAAYPLNRAFAETVLTVAYALDHPDYVERIMERRGDQPKELKRLQIKTLIDHITPGASGFRQVYDELCEITHFGSLAHWQPHVLAGEATVQWRSEPRWRNEREPLIACAQLKEMSTAAETYLHNFAGRHVLQ